MYDPGRSSADVLNARGRIRVLRLDREQTLKVCAKALLFYLLDFENSWVDFSMDFASCYTKTAGRLSSFLYGRHRKNDGFKIPIAVEFANGTIGMFLVSPETRIRSAVNMFCNVYLEEMLERR